MTDLEVDREIGRGRSWYCSAHWSVFDLFRSSFEVMCVSRMVESKYELLCEVLWLSSGSVMTDVLCFCVNEAAEFD